VNGLYEVTDEVSGGMPVYKKQGNEMWLEYHVSCGKWMSRHAAYKGQANKFCNASVDCDVGVLPDKAPRGIWRVCSNGALEVQASVVVTTMSAAEVAAESLVMQATSAAARAAAAIAKVRKRED